MGDPMISMIFKFLVGGNMKKIMRVTVMALFLITFLISCATSRGLRTEEVKTDRISGTFTLILYGARFSGDVENVAILDIEGDRYTFEVFAPDFDYRVRTHVPAQEAIKSAEGFIASHGSFKYPQISQIKDLEGRVIGYEFRPLYSPSEFGFFDVLDIDYWLEGNKVKVRIGLIPEVKQRLFNDESFSSDSQ